MIGLLALAAGLSAPCRAEDAHYVLRDAPQVLVVFRPVKSGRDWPSDLALEVHNTQSGQTSWWLPWLGGTDNLQNLASTTDVTAPDWRPPNPDDGPRPLGDRQYVGFDANYTVINDIPHLGQPAPNHILVPNAGSPRDYTFVTKQLFDLVSCSPPDDPQPRK